MKTFLKIQLKQNDMELAKFGNWSITMYKIEWLGDPAIEFSIPIAGIVATGEHKNCILYQWLIEIAADTRFSHEDIYSLNTAFFYALDVFSSEIDIPGHALIAETLREQQEILNERKRACMMPSAQIPRDNSTWFGKLYKL
jgi:hypothetical protein